MIDIVIFDALDTIMGYRGAELGRSKRFYQEKIAEAEGMSVEDLLANVPYDDILQMILQQERKGDLQPIILPGAKEIIELVRSSGNKPVIMTAGYQDTAEHSLRILVEAGLIDKEDINGIHQLGSKQDPRTWEQAKQMDYQDKRVLAVFEDTPTNLESALTAFPTSQGYLVTSDNYLAKHSNRIVSGNLRQLKSEIEKTLAAN